MQNQLDRIEWKLDQLLAALAVNSSGLGGRESAPRLKVERHLAEGDDGYLVKLTTKQHAALQMLMRGADNKEIADRFGVTDNTAKVHVRAIAKKIGVNTRAQIMHRIWREFDEIDENGYMAITGGLPKDWDDNHAEPDPFWRLYGEKRNDTTSDAEK